MLLSKSNIADIVPCLGNIIDIQVTLPTLFKSSSVQNLLYYYHPYRGLLTSDGFGQPNSGLGWVRVAKSSDFLPRVSGTHHITTPHIMSHHRLLWPTYHQIKAYTSYTSLHEPSLMHAKEEYKLVVKPGFKVS